MFVFNSVFKPLSASPEHPIHAAGALQQEELVFTFLPLLNFSAENKRDLLVDNWILEHPLLSIPLKLLLLL